jgi:hypothetical protein
MTFISTCDRYNFCPKNSYLKDCGIVGNLTKYGSTGVKEEMEKMKEIEFNGTSSLSHMRLSGGTCTDCKGSCKLDKATNKSTCSGAAGCKVYQYLAGCKGTNKGKCTNCTLCTKGIKNYEGEASDFPPGCSQGLEPGECEQDL